MNDFSTHLPRISAKTRAPLSPFKQPGLLTHFNIVAGHLQHALLSGR